VRLSQFSLPVVEAWIEDLVFERRFILIALLGAVTIAAAWFLPMLKIDTTLEKQLPLKHPIVETALGYRDKIPGLNSFQVALELRDGTIWSPESLKKLNEITQDVYYLPGVDRSSVASMWTPNTRIFQSTEGAVEARDLIPSSVSPDALTQDDVATIRDDAFRGGFRGQLFSRDGRAAMILAAVQEYDPQSKTKTDLFAVAEALETSIRKKHETGPYLVRITGFTPYVGEISREAERSVLFFFGAALIAAIAVWFYARSMRLAAIAVTASALSVFWLLGLLAALDIPLSPLGLIVPFIVYAIGVSHAVQQIHQFLYQRLHGQSDIDAARTSFRHLGAPGFYALVTCVCGFAAIAAIPIPLVGELALIAALGVGLMFVTNLVLLPVVMSLLRFSPEQLAKQNALAERRDGFAAYIAAEAYPVPAIIIVAVAIAATILALANTTRFIGDHQAGAPELWPSARFNEDTAAIAANFDFNTDLFVIAAEAKPDSCIDYPTMHVIERFTQHMRGALGVRKVLSVPEVSRTVHAIVQEGNLKWRMLAKDPQTLALTTGVIPSETGLLNKDCTLLTIAVYLDDHRDQTLRGVVAAAEAFIADPKNRVDGVAFKLATGNAAIVAAMNEAIGEAELPAMGLALIATIILVLAAFRDWRAVVACCAPLALATIFGHWLMSTMELGLKISTLPVLVIATGIGVDYAIYLHHRLVVHLREGLSVGDAYVMAMREKGIAVMFTGIVLSLAALSWAASGLKFQSDMGLMLGFMFFVNMILALTLLPSLTILLELVLPHKNSKTPTHL
jgi:uncharacterized protein